MQPTDYNLFMIYIKILISMFKRVMVYALIIFCQRKDLEREYIYYVCTSGPCRK